MNVSRMPAQGSAASRCEACLWSKASPTKALPQHCLGGAT